VKRDDRNRRRRDCYRGKANTFIDATAAMHVGHRCERGDRSAYVDFAFLPVYPPDLQLPAIEPQLPPPHVVRQAPGLSLSR